MKITEFVKKELTGWKHFEILGLFIVWSIVILNAIVNQDSIIAVISAICGITYTFIAGKGKISCYIFGVIGSGFYCYLALKNGLWGNLALYAGYYIPMQILGFFRWKKHLNSTTKEIIKISLSTRSRLVLTILSAIFCAITIFILKSFNDTNPIIDGITTILSITGMYLTVRRAIEQWFAWMVVNSLSAIMWINILLTGEKVYATVIMWITYFILAVYFYAQWRKELFFLNVSNPENTDNKQ